MDAPSPPTLIRLSTCTIDLDKKVVLRDGEATRLSGKEHELIRYLASRAGDIVTREELFTEVWGYAPNVVSRAVDATLLRVRKKIEEDPSNPVHLFSLYGQGYRFDCPEESKAPKARPTDLLQHMEDLPAPTPPVAPSRRFGRTGATQVGSAITGEMIGRDRELNDLVSRFTNGQRFVTLTGPGGMGKTRLAQEAGRHYLNQQGLAGGVWFVDLAGCVSGVDILHKVADTLEIPLQESTELSRTAMRLGRAMTHRGQFLLVLDNFEQIVSFAEDTVGTWLTVAPDVFFLVTSRQSLGVDGEVVVDVPPLSTEDAVALFVERAKAVKPSFLVREEHREILSDIVDRLDRIPLAIRLAAGRSRLMSVKQIQHRLKDRFKLLRRGPGLSRDRQATMEAAIDWSWNLLSDVERHVLQQCAVFRSGFTPEAAEAVIELMGDNTGLTVQEVLDGLASKSLLFIQQTPEASRMSPYDSVRYYAQERLASGALQAAHARHTQYFLTQGADLLDQMKTAQAHDAFAVMKREIDNFQAVFSRVRSQKPEDAYLAYRVCEAVFSVLDWHQPILDYCDALVPIADQLSEAQRLGMASDRAGALHGLGRVDEARAVLDTLRSTVRPETHRGRWVRATVHDALLLARKGQYDEAAEAMEQLLKDPENQPPDLRADILAGLGFVRRGQQRYEETVALWEEAVQLGRGVLRQFWIEQTENNIAAMKVQLGDLHTGRAMFLERLHRLRAFGYSQDVGLQLYNIAHVDLLLGDLDGAALHAQEANQRLRTGTAPPLYRAVSCVQFALIHHFNGHAEAAEALLDEARGLVDATQQALWLAHIDSVRAAMWVYRGARVKGEVLWESCSGDLNDFYALYPEEVKAIWDAHCAVASGTDGAEVQSLLATPGVCIPRTSGAFTPDPKRRGNPDHQIHLLMLEHATGGIPRG